jgi:hypothetical protein
MNNIIERYIYDVVRRIPENQRAEVSKELNSNIYEMLSDNPSKEEIEEVLQSLGHPRKLASDYRGDKRYLISPEWFEDYIIVLKFAALIIGGLTLITVLVDNIFNLQATTVFGVFFEVVFNTAGEVGNALFKVFSVVTLIFVVLDKVKKENKDNKFDTRFLPRLPDMKKRDISKFGTTASLIASVIFGSLFIYLLYMNTVYLVWIDGNGFNTSLPLFNSAVVKPFIVIFVVSLLINIGLDIFKLIEGQYTVRVAIYQTIAKVFSTVVTVIFLTRTNLLNPHFITAASNKIGMTVSEINNALNIAAILFLGLIVFGAVSETVTLWVKMYRQKTKTIKD